VLINISGVDPRFYKRGAEREPVTGLGRSMVQGRAPCGD